LYINHYLVLDPRIKLTYYEIQQWEREYIDLSKQIHIIDIIIMLLMSMLLLLILDITTDTNIRMDDFFTFSFGLMSNPQNEDELTEYLSKPVVHFKTDPLQWWKVIVVIKYHFFHQ